METVKPQEGSWETMEAYPARIKFEAEVPVIVSFASDFVQPLEMPNKDGNGVFYIFNVTSDGIAKSINTSSFTLLKSLKGNMPLANKTLEIIKKNVNGKNMFYASQQNVEATPEPVKIVEETI